jgi:hypothetical protein
MMRLKRDMPSMIKQKATRKKNNPGSITDIKSEPY